MRMNILERFKLYENWFFILKQWIFDKWYYRGSPILNYNSRRCCATAKIVYSSCPTWAWSRRKSGLSPPLLWTLDSTWKSMPDPRAGSNVYFCSKIGTTLPILIRNDFRRNIHFSTQLLCVVYQHFSKMLIVL